MQVARSPVLASTLTACMLHVVSATASPVRPKSLTTKAALSATTLDLGEITQREHATGPLILTNNGTETITVTDISTTCGCTTAKILDRIIAPGCQSKIYCTIDSGMRLGRMTISVTVHWQAKDRIARQTLAHIHSAVLPATRQTTTTLRPPTNSNITH